MTTTWRTSSASTTRASPRSTTNRSWRRASTPWTSASGAVVDLSIELPDGVLRTKTRVAETSIDGDSLPGPSPRVLAGLEFLALAAADELRLRAFLDIEAKRRRGAHTPPA